MRKNHYVRESKAEIFALAINSITNGLTNILIIFAAFAAVGLIAKNLLPGIDILSERFTPASQFIILLGIFISFISILLFLAIVVATARKFIWWENILGINLRVKNISLPRKLSTSTTLSWEENGDEKQLTLPAPPATH
jgi:hypothetical protein